MVNLLISESKHLSLNPRHEELVAFLINIRLNVSLHLLDKLEDFRVDEVVNADLSRSIKASDVRLLFDLEHLHQIYPVLVWIKFKQCVLSFFAQFNCQVIC